MTKEKSSRTPVLMSALGYPGVGQFMQKRVIWGLVYAVSFTLFFLVSCVILGRGIFEAFYNGTAVGNSLRAVARPIGLAIFVWLANIYDAWWWSYKQQRTTPGR